MSPQDYEIVIRPLTEAEGAGFLATVPELPGCMSDGESPQEALENVFDAILCWMEAAREMGRPIPEPKLDRAA
jgi:antitoxin HicB